MDIVHGTNRLATYQMNGALDRLWGMGSLAGWLAVVVVYATVGVGRCYFGNSGAAAAGCGRVRDETG